MSKMISVFSDENDMTIIHNGNLGWQVAEQLDEVVNIWKNVNNSQVKYERTKTNTTK